MENTSPTVPPAPARSWFTLPISVENTPAGTRIQIAWRRLIAQLAALAVTLWLLGSLGGYLWIRFGQDFPGARFVDVAFPQRWTALRKAWGDHFITLARAELKAQKWIEGIHHLRYGVARSPGNVDGRLILTQIFLASRKPEMAEQTMLAGFAYSKDDLNYLKPLCSLLLQTQSDETILDLNAKYLPAKPSGTPQEQLLALTGAMARYYRGNYDAAEDLVDRFELWRTKEGRILQIWIEWERGYRDVAINRLVTLIRDFPQEDDYYREMTRYQRQLGSEAQFQRYALLRQSANPRNPEAHIDLMHAYHRSKNAARLTREIDAYLAEFSKDTKALLHIAEFAANTGDSALTRRILETAKGADANNPELPALMLMWVEAHVVAGDHRQAIELIERFSREEPDWFKNRAGVYAGLRAIAHFGLGQNDLGELYLKNFLGQKNLRAENLVAVSNRLVAIRRFAEAREVLSNAATLDPKNQAAVAKLVEIDLADGRTDHLAANIQRLLGMRRPSSELLERVQRELVSDRYLFLNDRDTLIESVRSMLDRSVSRPAKSTG